MPRFKKQGWFCTQLTLGFPRMDLFSWSADDLEQEKEDLDNVNIDGERSEHVLLWADGVLPVSYQKLCVVG